MTCGACHPEAFRPDSGGRVFGYVVARDPTAIASATTRLAYLGAQHVFADLPHGNVRYRKGLQRLRKVMRPKDRLVLYHIDALGQRQNRASAILSEIEADGIETAIIRPGYFEG